MLYSLTLWAHGKPSKIFFAHHGDTSFIGHLKYSNTFTAYYSAYWSATLVGFVGL